MAYSPQTSPTTVTAATPNFLFSAPSIARGAASSRRVITSSVTGSQTCPEIIHPYHVRNDPLIFAGCALKRPKAKPARTTGTTALDNSPLLDATEYKGELLIRDLWYNGTDSVHDMCVVNTVAKSHSSKPPEKCLKESVRAKNLMYLEACLQ